MPSQEKHVSTGSTDLGYMMRYIRATSQCTVGVLGVEADFERLKYRVASAISRNNHNRSCGTCNMPLTTRRDKAQCNVKRHAGWQPTPSVCWMKVECRGAIANATAPKASKIFDHVFRCYRSTPSRSAINSTTANSSLFAPTMCGRSHIGSNLRESSAGWLHNPCRLGSPHRFKAWRNQEAKVAHKWAEWLQNPCRLGGPHRFRKGGRIRTGPQVGKVAT